MLFKKKKKIIDLTKNTPTTKNSIQKTTSKKASGGFLEIGSIQTTSKTQFSTESSGYTKKEVDAKIIELDNKIYKLEQRIELLERKLDIPKKDSGLIGW